MGHMWGARNTLLINSIDKNGIVCMFIDGSHKVCTDGKGYSRMLSIIGRELMMSMSKNRHCKFQLN